MYTQERRSAGDVYIPSNYRGNALYFEEIQREREREPQRDECRDDSCHNCAQNQGECREPRCASPCNTHAPAHSLGSLSKLFSGDNIIILALLAFFLFSGKEKSEDNTVLLLLLLLLF